MPKLNLTIPDVDNSVTRNVVLGVLKDLSLLMYLPEATKVIYPDLIEETYQSGSAMGQPEEVARLSNLPKVTIIVRESLIEPEAGRQEINHHVNGFLFVDDKLRIFLQPNYTFVNVDVTFQVSHTNRVVASQWRDEIRNRVQQGRQQFVHRASYHYRIHPIGQTILKELHRLREARAGYGEDFLTYFKAHLNPRVVEASSQSGSYTEFVMSETLTRILGSFDFVTTPDEPDQQPNKTNQDVSFTYRFQYDKPTSLTLDYPIMVHNQLLSSKYRERESKFAELNRTELMSFSNNAFRYFESNAQRFFSKPRLDGISMPMFDDFIPKSVQFQTNRIFTGLLGIEDPSPNQILMNLNGMKDYKFKPILVDFLKQEAPYMTQEYASILQLDLYEWGIPIDKRAKAIRVDEHLNVYNTKTLDLRVIYHLRLGLMTDLRLLTPEALERLRLNACVLRELIGCLYPEAVSVIQSIYDEDACGPVSKENLDDLLKEIDRVRDGAGNPIGMYTVGVFTVESWQKLLYNMETNTKG